MGRDCREERPRIYDEGGCVCIYTKRKDINRPSNFLRLHPRIGSIRHFSTALLQPFLLDPFPPIYRSLCKKCKWPKLHDRREFVGRDAIDLSPPARPTSISSRHRQHPSTRSEETGFPPSCPVHQSRLDRSLNRRHPRPPNPSSSRIYFSTRPAISEPARNCTSDNAPRCIGGVKGWMNIHVFLKCTVCIVPRGFTGKPRSGR